MRLVMLVYVVAFALFDYDYMRKSAFSQQKCETIFIFS